MAITPDVQKHLEAIVGHKLSPQEQDLIKLFSDDATSNIRFDGSVTSRSILIAAPNRCRQEALIDVAGIARTGADGKARFLLNQFLCPPNKTYAGPVNVVATPLSLTPLYLTLNHTILTGGTDVQIDVLTWNPDGTPAPNVTFDWRCRAVLPNVIT